MEEGHDRQRFYRIALAVSSLKNAGAGFDLLEDHAAI
jgi:hypothetical protein